MSSSDNGPPKELLERLYGGRVDPFGCGSDKASGPAKGILSGVALGGSDTGLLGRYEDSAAFKEAVEADKARMRAAEAEKFKAFLADREAAAEGQKAYAAEAFGPVGQGESMAERVARAQAAEKRRARNALAGAHANLAERPVPGFHSADVVAGWRDLIGDLSEALERWHNLHTPCDCGPNEECGKCPVGES